MQYQNKFEACQPSYIALRKSIVHNDPNDNNIIVTQNRLQPKAKAAIDYGDAIHTQIINDAAILCAYGIMGHNDPLDAALAFIKGYHFSFPLLEKEIVHLYNAIAMRLLKFLKILHIILLETLVVFLPTQMKLNLKIGQQLILLIYQNYFLQLIALKFII